MNFFCDFQVIDLGLHVDIISPKNVKYLKNIEMILLMLEDLL